MTEGIVSLIVTGIFSLLGGGLVSFLMLKVNKQEVISKSALNDANAIEIIRRVSKDLLEDMEKKVETMENQIQAMQSAYNRQSAQIQYLLNGIRMLIKQLIDLNQTPCWSPDDMDQWSLDGEDGN